MKPIPALCLIWVALSSHNLAAQETENLSFHPYFSYVAEGWSLVDGGTRTGERSLGLLIAGFDWSPTALAGGKLHLEVQSMHGRSPSGYAGDFNALSNVDFDEGARLFQAWYGREADWGAWKTGLLALDDDFMTSDYADLFINAGFGPMPTQSGNVAAPVWPIGGIGAHAILNLSQTSSLQLGTYDGDAGSFTSNENGLNNSLDGNEGYMLMMEYAKSTESFGGQTTWKLGGYHHTGKQFSHQQSGSKEKGLGSLYLVIDHITSEKLASWVRLSSSLDEEISTVATHIDGGIVFSGPLSKRPDDQLGIGFLRTEFGDEYLAATPNASHAETVLELTYHAPISENFHFQPDFQWIFDAHESRNDVFVLGLRIRFDY